MEDEGAERRDLRFRGALSMAIQDRLEFGSLTAYFNGRFEKEFEGVQDVFELQVRPDTSTSRMTAACKTLCHIYQLRPLLWQLHLPLRYRNPG